MIAFLSRLLGRRPKPKSSPLIEVPEEWMPSRGMETGLLVDKPMPRASIWDTVMIEGNVLVQRERPDNCLHTFKAKYVRIDHRAGPGSFADNYEGTVCTHCATILKERQTW